MDARRCPSDSPESMGGSLNSASAGAADTSDSAAKPAAAAAASAWCAGACCCCGAPLLLATGALRPAASSSRKAVTCVSWGASGRAAAQGLEVAVACHPAAPCCHTMQLRGVGPASLRPSMRTPERLTMCAGRPAAAPGRDGATLQHLVCRAEACEDVAAWIGCYKLSTSWSM